MIDLEKIKADAAAAIVEVDARIADPDEPNKRLLNGIRTGLEMTLEAAEALSNIEAPDE